MSGGGGEESSLAELILECRVILQESACAARATELAQLEERPAFNRVVVGSSPIFGVSFFLVFPAYSPAFSLLVHPSFF